MRPFIMLFASLFSKSAATAHRSTCPAPASPRETFHRHHTRRSLATAPMAAGLRSHRLLAKIFSAAGASCSGTIAINRPSLARWSGSRPRISHAPRTSSRTGTEFSSIPICDRCGLGDFDESTAQTTARQVTQAVNSYPGLQQCCYRLPQRRAIGLNCGFEQPLARCHNGDAMPPQVAAQNHRIAGLDADRRRC